MAASMAAMSENITQSASLIDMVRLALSWLSMSTLCCSRSISIL